MFLTDGHSVGLRKDLGGVLLLDSALQTPVTNSSKDVMVEIPYSEVRNSMHVYWIVEKSI